MSQKTILIGEDELNISEMYRISFEQAGFKVVVAANGVEVIEKTKKVNPHLLLLDINMPVKDGFEVLKDISEDPKLFNVFKRIPIFVLSNYSNSQDMDYCSRMGAQEYIVKADWTPKAVVQRVADYLEKLDKI